MAIQTVAYDLKGIHDPAGYEEVMKALTTIGGVQAVHLEPENHRVIVSFDDTQTSVFAFKAALTNVDYITDPFPIEAPANPANNRTLMGDLAKDGRLS